jgi:hypothetical protein
MAQHLRIAVVFVIGLVLSGCTTCGGWSKFTEFPKACHSDEMKW